VEHIGGDMFESVPKADAIFMKVSEYELLLEFCSLSNIFCSFPTEMTIMSLHELTHASVNLFVS